MLIQRNYINVKLKPKSFRIYIYMYIYSLLLYKNEVSEPNANW